MPGRRNLISDSLLVQETLDLLRDSGGSVSAVTVVDSVLKLSHVQQDLAVKIVGDLISNDRRLRMQGSDVELFDEDIESRLLTDSEFVVVDVETTGAKTPPGRVIEIGAYRVRGGKIVAEFDTLLNPDSSIPPFISHLTGISADMVKDAPVFEDIVDKWLEFVGDAVLVAHNAMFDIRFINHEISRVYPGYRMANPSICTVSLSRRVFPGLDNYRLHTVAEHCAISIRNRHRAAGDARATAGVLIRILETFHQYGVRDLASARRFRFSN